MLNLAATAPPSRLYAHQDGLESTFSGPSRPRSWTPQLVGKRRYRFASRRAELRQKQPILLRHWDTNDRAKIDRRSCRPSGAANNVPCIASWRCNVIRINIGLQWTSTLRGMREDLRRRF